MKTASTCTVLRYVHDIATGEFVNVGVVFHGPEASDCLIRGMEIVPEELAGECSERFAREVETYAAQSSDH